MLQFITHESERYSIAEEVQMAIEGGCRWIQLNMDGAAIEHVREVAMEIIPMCRENDVFLLIADNVELVNELKVWGVHIVNNAISPLMARNVLGPHAIVGVNVDDAEQIIALKGKDIDYVSLGCFNNGSDQTGLACNNLSIKDYSSMIAEVRGRMVDIPIVAYGDIGIDDVLPLISAGVNGIAMSEAIINATDPVEYTRAVIALLNNTLR